MRISERKRQEVLSSGLEVLRCRRSSKESLAKVVPKVPRSYSAARKERSATKITRKSPYECRRQAMLVYPGRQSSSTIALRVPSRLFFSMYSTIHSMYRPSHFLPWPLTAAIKFACTNFETRARFQHSRDRASRSSRTSSLTTNQKIVCCSSFGKEVRSILASVGEDSCLVGASHFRVCYVRPRRRARAVGFRSVIGALKSVGRQVPCAISCVLHRPDQQCS